MSVFIAERALMDALSEQSRTMAVQLKLMWMIA